MSSLVAENPEDPSIHPILTKTGDGEVLASDADAEVLARMGYKQELKRNFTALEVFGIAFSIMGLLPSISSTLAFSLPAGPAGMVWSWFIASGCIFLVGLAMADLGSAMPTSGGLYWWTVRSLGPAKGHSRWANSGRHSTTSARQRHEIICAFLSDTATAWG